MLAADQLDQAKCAAHLRNGGEDFWFPTSPHPSTHKFAHAEAIRICNGCPIKLACLEDALLQTPLPPHGVWGGLAPGELHALGMKTEAFCGECGRKYFRTFARQVFCSRVCANAVSSRLANEYASRGDKEFTIDPFTELLFEDLPRFSGKGRQSWVKGEDRHGNSSGYNHDKCRCEKCRAWKSTKDAAYRRKNKRML